jgi:hypothetical protein
MPTTQTIGGSRRYPCVPRASRHCWLKYRDTHPGCHSLVRLHTRNDYWNWRSFWRILDSFHLSLTIAAVYHYLITSFGELLAIQLVDWYRHIDLWLSLRLTNVLRRLKVIEFSVPIPTIVIHINPSAASYSECGSLPTFFTSLHCWMWQDCYNTFCTNLVRVACVEA